MREPRQDPGYREAPKTSMLTPIAQGATRGKAPIAGEVRRKKLRKFTFLGVR